MTRGAFPDVLGPQFITANAGTPKQLRKVLNFVGTGIAGADNPGRKRYDITLTSALQVNSLSQSNAGEWQPNAGSVGTPDIDLLRVSSSVTGVILTGFDVTGTPTQAEKYIANFGTHSIDLQPPASVVGGHIYFIDSYTLRVNETVHIVYDSVSNGYRILSASASAHQYILVNGVNIAVNTNRLHQG